MRRSRLGRWLLRGALVAAGAAAIGGAGAHASSMGDLKDFQWGTDSVNGTESSENSDVTNTTPSDHEEKDDFQWG